MDDTLKSDLVATAHALADAARPVTLRHFRRTGLVADNKEPAHFDPVTVADRDAEAAMRAVLAARRPDDGIIGEEHGTESGSSGFTWVLDPIDGTRGYISGTPTWGTLIAVNSGGAPLFGIVDQPYIGERFFGGLGRSGWQGPHGGGHLGTRPADILSEAVIFTTFPEVGTGPEGDAFHELARQCRLTRYGMDCYAYALLAIGQVDLVVEAGLSAYDIQGPMAVVEAAGGIVTNWQGGLAEQGGQVIAAGSRAVHKAALDILARCTD